MSSDRDEAARMVEPIHRLSDDPVLAVRAERELREALERGAA